MMEKARLPEVNLSMVKTRIYLASLFFILAISTFTSQNGETGRFDCTYSKEIIVPFNYSPIPNMTVKPMLDQKVFYSFRDQFTYWYKVVVKQDALIGFKVKALNDSDSYSVYVYNYNEQDFCRKVFYQKILPVKSTFFIGKGSSAVKGQIEKKFNALNGNVYYIGVLNTSLNNCGHRFSLFYGKDTLRVDALHLPCKRDVSGIVISNEKKSVLKKDTAIQMASIKKDTVKPQPEIMPDPVSKSFYITIAVLNAKNKLPLESKIYLNEKTSGGDIEAVQKSKGEFKVWLEEGKTYLVKGNSLGYKVGEITIDASSARSQKKEREEIFLEPLKQGESFILRSIYFVPNTYVLRKESLEELEKLLNYLKNNESTVIEIQGHTNGDNRIYKNAAYASLGEEWNYAGSAKKLSQKRAEIIKTYMLTHGISESRLVAKGYGGEKALVKDPETNEEAQKNIRVEISVLKD